MVCVSFNDALEQIRRKKIERQTMWRHSKTGDSDIIRKTKWVISTLLLSNFGLEFKGLKGHKGHWTFAYHQLWSYSIAHKRNFLKIVDNNWDLGMRFWGVFQRMSLGVDRGSGLRVKVCFRAKIKNHWTHYLYSSTLRLNCIYSWGPLLYFLCSPWTSQLVNNLWVLKKIVATFFQQ